MEMATQKQLDYLKVLGASEEAMKGLNIKEASKMIGQLKKSLKTPKNVERTHHYKVGDVLEMSWGYDQTNEDFFVITELVGKSSIRIKECVMEEKKCENYSHGMARNISYEPTTALPISKSYWIKDQEGKGDLHKVIHSNYCNKDIEYIKIENRYYAYKYNGETVYESWYA